MADPLRKMLLPLWTSDTHTHLAFVPSALTLLDILCIFVVLTTRSIFHYVAGFFPARFSDHASGMLSAKLSLSMPFGLQKADIDSYSEAISLQSQAGSTQRPADQSDVPSRQKQFSAPKLCTMLSAITEPAILLLIAKRQCPINPLGAVNVRNRFELLRPDLFYTNVYGDCLEKLTAMEGAMLSAAMTTYPVIVKRGLEYILEVELLLPDVDGGRHVAAFRQVFTILELVKHKDVSAQTVKSLQEPVACEITPSSTTPYPTISLFMEANAPSKWARVCKDYNPIHVFTIAAKGFGFPGKLAHGNHVVARALAVLDDSETAAHILGKQDLKDALCPTWMDVAFKRPVVVPTSLQCKIVKKEVSGSATDIEVLQRGKTAVTISMGGL